MLRSTCGKVGRNTGSTQPLLDTTIQARHGSRNPAAASMVSVAFDSSPRTDQAERRLRTAAVPERIKPRSLTFDM